MPDKITTNRKLKVIIHASHRNGICIECLSQMEVKEVDIGEGRIRKRVVCPKCGGMIGQLIAKPISIQGPDSPRCARFKCLWKFAMDSLFIGFLSSYHGRRLAYAEMNRPENKRILEKYRTGEPAPKTIRQAILAIIELKCRR